MKRCSFVVRQEPEDNLKHCNAFTLVRLHELNIRLLPLKCDNIPSKSFPHFLHIAAYAGVRVAHLVPEGRNSQPNPLLNRA
jgi:hypothetical protein